MHYVSTRADFGGLQDIISLVPRLSAFRTASDKSCAEARNSSYV